jgi:dihydroorotate dehydrogenase electron transfer subunit
MKKIYDPIIMNQKEIAPNIFRMELIADEIVRAALPGQFINIYCKEGQNLLPRPISICEVDKKNGILTLVYGVVGKGTLEFSLMKNDETIKVLGPLGNGFNIDKNIKTHILIGGGIGVPPLVELAKNLTGEIYAFLGFAENPILVQELENYCTKVFVATDKGEVGFKGNVIDLIKNEKVSGDMIYSCGPKPMLKAVSAWAKEMNIKAQISMEQRIACGIGVCVGCTCKHKKKEDKDFQNKKVCTDGPVFWSEEVLWDE